MHFGFLSHIDQSSSVDINKMFSISSDLSDILHKSNDGLFEGGMLSGDLSSDSVHRLRTVSFELSSNVHRGLNNSFMYEVGLNVELGDYNRS